MKPNSIVKHYLTLQNQFHTITDSVDSYNMVIASKVNSKLERPRQAILRLEMPCIPALGVRAQLSDSEAIGLFPSIVAFLGKGPVSQTADNVCLENV